jgi:hypothetical protein
MADLPYMYWVGMNTQPVGMNTQPDTPRRS